MGLANRLRGSYRAALSGQAISKIAGGILTIALARILNPDEFGLLFLAISIFGIVQLFSRLGIASSAARYIAEYKESNPSQIPNILRFSFLLNIGTILIVCLVYLLLIQSLSNQFDEPSLEPLLLLGVFFIALSTVFTYNRRILQGLEEIRVSSILRAANDTTRLIIVLTFVFLGLGAAGALTGYVLAFGLSVSLGLGYLYRFHYKSIQRSPIEQGLQRKVAKYTVPLTFTSMANVIENKVDTILVGFLIGPAPVAFYTISKQIITFLETPVTALGYTLSPTYEALKTKGDVESAADIYEHALANSLLLYIPASAGLALVAENLILVVFGRAYLDTVPVLQVFAIYMALRSISQLTSNGLDYLGRGRDHAIVQWVSASLNIVLNLILIPLIGVLGAAIATVITYSLYTFINTIILVIELNLQLQPLFHKIGKVIIITSIMSVFVIVIKISLTGIVSIIAMIAVGTVVWGVLSVLTGLLDKRQISLILKR